MSVISLPLRLGVGLAGVGPECAGGRKLAELVTHHVVGYGDGNELVAIVDGDGEADHLGDHGGAAGPGLDHALVHGRLGGLDLLLQVGVNEWALFKRTCHWASPS